MSKKLTIEEFIEKSNKIHREKYDYSKVNYINNYIKIIIICPKHREFLQRPNSHLNGCGCPVCGFISSNKTRSKSASKFIKDAKNIHKNKYNYSKVNYINSHTKIKIICKKHGRFFQLPLNHLRGEGCSKCRYENIKILKPKSESKFIKECKKIHKNEYDYSKVNYIRAHTKIIIICKKHGKFYQTANHHLQGNKCPKCAKIISRQEIEFLNYVDIPDTIKNRQIYIKRKKVDGYDGKTNTIYEFLGDFWHGNPKIHNKNDINRVIKKTFGELYKNTLKRFNILKKMGYNIKYIWENDWKRFKKGIDKKPKILRYKG
jgi:hypothetical protein